MSDERALTDEDIDDIMPESAESIIRYHDGYSPPAPQYPTRGNLALVPQSQPLGPIPDASELADEQHLAGMRRLALDSSSFPRFPWPEVDKLTDPLAPEDLLFVLARTGHGKSTLLMNTLEDMVEQQQRRCLYIGTEQNPEVLKIKWACLRRSVAPKVVLKARAEDRMSEVYQFARQAVEEEMELVRQRCREKYAMFATSRYVNATELERWVTGAVKQYGCQVVFIDHIDEVDHGDGKNSRHENTQTLNLIQRLNKDLKVPFIIASQSKRLQDKALKFTPPDLEDLAENSNKERKSTLVLGVWRPLKAGVTDKEIKAVKLGQADEGTLFEPDLMALKILKKREDTGELGRQTRLRVVRGRLEHIAERDKYTTDTMTRGPRP
jgi:hypothetical protein